MNKTLIFEHIPKTAGSTFRYMLRKEYKNIYSFDWANPGLSISNFEKLGTQKQNVIELIEGHAASQLAKYIRNPVFLTYLRDPVDRFISQFYFIKRYPEHRSHKTLSKFNSIEEYLEFAVNYYEDNLQTRFLSDSVLSFFGALKPGNHHEDKSQLLQQAKKRLQSFNYVFFTHQFDLSLIILKKELNWRYYPYYITRNKTKNRPLKSDFNDTVLEKIRNVEKYDIELVEFAKSLNDKLLSNYKLDEELAKFRYYNRLHRPITLAGYYKNKAHLKLRQIFN